MQSATPFAVAVCRQCGRREYLAAPFGQPDEELVQEITRRGWTTQPLRCPACRQGVGDSATN